MEDENAEAKIESLSDQIAEAVIAQVEAAEDRADQAEAVAEALAIAVVETAEQTERERLEAEFRSEISQCHLKITELEAATMTMQEKLTALEATMQASSTPPQSPSPSDVAALPEAGNPPVEQVEIVEAVEAEIIPAEESPAEEKPAPNPPIPKRRRVLL